MPRRPHTSNGMCDNAKIMSGFHRVNINKSTYGCDSIQRESFLDYLQGPNENRFVPFNNMPRVCSKYNTSYAGGHSFQKQLSREQGAKSARMGSAMQGKRFLQDYDYNFECNKTQLAKGGGNYLLFM